MRFRDLGIGEMKNHIEFNDVTGIVQRDPA